MSLQVSIDNIAKELICPICKLICQEPHVLNCKHNFCRKCVFRILDVKKNDSICPVCSLPTRPNEVQRNHTLESIVNTWSGIYKLLQDIATHPLAKKKSIIQYPSNNNSSKEFDSKIYNQIDLKSSEAHEVPVFIDLTEQTNKEPIENQLLNKQYKEKKIDNKSLATKLCSNESKDDCNNESKEDCNNESKEEKYQLEKDLNLVQENKSSIQKNELDKEDHLTTQDLEAYIEHVREHKSLLMSCQMKSKSDKDKRTLSQRSDTSDTSTHCSSNEEIEEVIKNSTSAQINLKRSEIREPVLAATGLSAEELKIVRKACKDLNGVLSSHVLNENNFTATHLITSFKDTPLKTVKYIQGISCGCWILDFDWVLSSLNSGFWLLEEEYEVLGSTGVPHLARLRKAKNSLPLFIDYALHLLVSLQGSKLPIEDWLTQLTIMNSKRIYSVDIFSNTVAYDPEAVKSGLECIIIASDEFLSSGHSILTRAIAANLLIVHQSWIVDCISDLKIHPYSSYLISL